MRVGKQKARTRCGGADGLAEAVSEGNVAVTTDNRGRERYHFDCDVAEVITTQTGTLEGKGNWKLIDEQWKH